MGEYEDRYPESYRREEVPPTGPATPPPNAVERPLFRSRPGTAEAAWQHAPSASTATAAAPRRMADSYRGVGPRGYVRSPERIYEDVCDRLTDNPFIDASDVEVRVSGTEVVLAGSVDDGVALRQAERIAAETSGVTRVHNRLSIRATGER